MGMEKEKTRLRGSCLCACVKIAVKDRFSYFGSCHCSQCRKFSGSAFSVVAGIPYEDFEVVSGESYITYYAKSETGTLAFCGNCGSSLFGDRSDIKMIHLRAGILDDPPSQQPTYHVCTRSKAPWYQITDSLKQFEELPPSVKRD
jgi:hypothetical protein